MAIKFGFYNSVNNDRMYDARDFGSLFDGIISDGVFDNIGNLFAVQRYDGTSPNTVFVGSGKGWFNQTWIENTSEMSIILPAPHATQRRIDAVVIDINSDDNVRKNDIIVVSGAVASRPIKPTLINTDTHHQYPLAYITRRPGITDIEASDIENAVGTTATPLVIGVLETADISVLIQQWTTDAEEAFAEWLQHLRNELDSNQAAHLQNQIDTLSSQLGNLPQRVNTLENDVSSLETSTNDLIMTASELNTLNSLINNI